MTEGIALPGTPAYDRILDQMVERETQATIGLQYPLWRQGQVAALPTSTQPKVQVFMNGDTDTIIYAKYLHSYRPRINDVVWLVQNGSDVVITGTTTLPSAQRFFTTQTTVEGSKSTSTYSSNLVGDSNSLDLTGIWLYSGQELWVEVNCIMVSVTSSDTAFMSFQMTGASSLGLFDTNAAQAQQSNNTRQAMSRITRVTTGATGFHDFTAFYKKGTDGNNGGSVTFQFRRLNVTLG